ncbi:hypothetical protein GIB67_003340 [Kingdonia uniflora]|uniref:Uncharacterized protein n=1 Tax=Kingdonia uniflora TaxID=39325 RepID=A0A7J7P988_9MAGN|nr:hypothetical protein GIB67_003340 [Kingdonia uniflora]
MKLGKLNKVLKDQVNILTCELQNKTESTSHEIEVLENEKKGLHDKSVILEKEVNDVKEKIKSTLDELHSAELDVVLYQQKLEKFCHGAKNIDKILCMGKTDSDKRGLGYEEPLHNAKTPQITKFMKVTASTLVPKHNMISTTHNQAKQCLGTISLFSDVSECTWSDYRWTDTEQAKELDAGPRLVQKLIGFGDRRTSKIVAQIADEEVAHVAIGVFWFYAVCQKLGCVPCDTFKGSPHLEMEPFNYSARDIAEIPRDWYDLAFRDEPDKTEQLSEVYKRLSHVISMEKDNSSLNGDLQKASSCNSTATK